MLFLIPLFLLGTAVLGQLPVQNRPLQKRIMGGQFVPVNHLPYQALIRQWFDTHNKLKQTYMYQCGAILIDPQWVLTAEHCLAKSDLNVAPIEVFLGASHEDQINADLNGTMKEPVVKRRVARYFRGPRVQIGKRTENSTLLLLKLDRKVETSANIRPIELPVEGAHKHWPYLAVVSGFGKTANEPHGEVPKRPLQYAKVPINRKAYCLEMYQKQFPNDNYQLRRRVAPESIFCAGYEEGGYGSCVGDYGGPLAICASRLQDTSGGRLLCEDNRWQLAGVALDNQRVHREFPNTCAGPNNPGLYATVPVFSGWIRRTMDNN